MIQQIVQLPRPDAAPAPDRGARREGDAEFTLPHDDALRDREEQAPPRESHRGPEKASEERAVARASSVETALRAARAETTKRARAAEEHDAEQVAEQAQQAALVGGLLAQGPAARDAAMSPITAPVVPTEAQTSEDRAPRRPVVARQDGARPEAGAVRPRVGAAKPAPIRPELSQAAQSGAGAEGEEAEPRAQIDGSAKIIEAARVEHALRGAHRQTASLGGTVGALADAVRRALKALAEGQGGKTGALDELLQSGKPNDGAAFGALLARAEGTAQSSLVAARAATAMATPTGASSEGGLPTFELGGDLGMVVRIRSEDAGDIEVRVQLDGKSVHVRVRAEEAANRARLLDMLPALRRELERLPELAMAGARVDVQEDAGERRQGAGKGREQTGEDVAEDAPELSELREALGLGAHEVRARS